MDKIGELIKKLRISRNISQPELADILEISASMMGMIEQGRRKPSDEVKLKLCEFFDISMDYLMGRTTMQNPTREIELQLSKLNLSSEEYDNLLNKWIVEQKIDNLDFDKPNSIIFKVYMDYLAQKPTNDTYNIEEMKQNTNIVDNDFINMLKCLNKKDIISSDNINKTDTDVERENEKQDFRYASYNSINIDGLNENDIKEINNFVEFIRNKKKNEKK